MLEIFLISLACGTGLLTLGKSSPLILMLLLIFYCLLLSMILAVLGLEVWFSYMLVLVFLGGMLVIFLYLTSLVPNKRHDQFSGLELSMKSFFSALLFLGYYVFDWGAEKNMLHVVSYLSESSVAISMFLYQVSSKFYMFLVIYLFVALIISAWMVSVEEGPLRLK